jgi:hypothetical protein
VQCDQSKPEAKVEVGYDNVGFIGTENTNGSKNCLRQIIRKVTNRQQRHVTFLSVFPLRIALHNPHFDRLWLLVYLHKWLYIK